MITLRARYVFPVDRPPIEDGVVSLEGDRIVAVEPYSGQACMRERFNSALIPALVNAHTHLEFSDLKRPLGKPGMPFVEWIRTVIDYRQRLQSDPGQLADLRWPYARPVEEGLREALSGGTTAIGEIAAAPPQADFSKADVTAFLELRGPRSVDVEPQLGAAAAYLRLPFGYRQGLSPHAPYTVHASLLAGAVALCRSRNVPLAMHLAESREEIEFLQTGRGPLHDLLAERGLWEEDPQARLPTPLGYLQRLSAAPRTLVIHGNYLNDEEINYLAAQRDRMSVVFCPRTHAYFRHARHPWQEMLQRGVNVCLGTDSRASNPDLSVLEEVRFLVHHLGASPSEALQLGTLAGAKALGIAEQYGTLTPGKMASFACIQLARNSSGDPYERLLNRKSQPGMIFHRGRPLTKL
jgi:cytosine/adenosine deaminase-related metal-dependent hydrolase